METTNEVVAPEHYNPHQLVTYKVIDGDNVSYPTKKVTDIEMSLDGARFWKQQWDKLSGNVARLENDLPEYLDMDAEDIVAAICDIFGFNPTKEVEFEATVRVSGTIEVPLSSLKDFDIDYADISVNVDCYEYNINADAEIESINTV
jgi:hypothetical protein